MNGNELVILLIEHAKELLPNKSNKSNVPPSQLADMASDILIRLVQVIEKYTSLKVLPLRDTLTRLSLVTEEVERKQEEKKECRFMPLEDDRLIRKGPEMAHGIYGRTYAVTLSVECLNEMDPRTQNLNKVSAVRTIPAVVKEALSTREPYVAYRNSLHEILINQKVIREAVKAGNNAFALMYAFILCDVPKRKRPDHFCEPSSRALASYTTIALNSELENGDMALFPVYEKVEGVTFRATIVSNAFHSDDFEILYDLMTQIIGGLDQLNRRQIYTHNDLHPSNVMVTREHGKLAVKIIDQGMAAASFDGYLALFKYRGATDTVGCLMGTDLLKIFTSVFNKLEKGSYSEKLILKVMTALFGPEVFAFLAGQVSEDNSFVEYLAYLSTMCEGNVEKFRLCLAATYSKALRVLKSAFLSVQSSAYKSLTLAYRRAKRHYGKAHPITLTLKEGKEKDTEKVIREIVRQHNQGGKQVCSCLPFPERVKEEDEKES